ALRAERSAAMRPAYQLSIWVSFVTSSACDSAWCGSVNPSHGKYVSDRDGAMIIVATRVTSHDSARTIRSCQTVWRVMRSVSFMALLLVSMPPLLRCTATPAPMFERAGGTHVLGMVIMSARAN